MRQVRQILLVKQPYRPIFGRLYCRLSGAHEFPDRAPFCRICKYPRLLAQKQRGSYSQIPVISQDVVK